MRLHIKYARIRIDRCPLKASPTTRPRKVIRSQLAAGTFNDKRLKHRAQSKRVCDLQRLRFDLRRKVNQIIFTHTLAVECRGLGGERLRR